MYRMYNKKCFLGYFLKLLEMTIPGQRYLSQLSFLRSELSKKDSAFTEHAVAEMIRGT